MMHGSAQAQMSSCLIPWRGGTLSEKFSVPFFGEAPILSVQCLAREYDLTIGKSGMDILYIYKTAYTTTDGDVFSQPIPLTGERMIGSWIIGRATARIPYTPIASPQNYIAFYACVRGADGSFTCGCDERGQCSDASRGYFRWYLGVVATRHPLVTPRAETNTQSTSTSPTSPTAPATSTTRLSRSTLTKAEPMTIRGDTVVEGKWFDCGGTGTAIIVRGDNNVIRNNLFTNCPSAIFGGPASNTMIAGNRCEVCGQFAVLVEGENNQVLYNEIAGGATINDERDDMMNNVIQIIENGPGTRIIGNKIDNREHPGNFSEDYINVYGNRDPVIDVVVSDNILVGAGGYYSSTGGAIIMDGKASQIRITNNHIHNIAAYGIGISGSGRDILIEGNTVYLDKAHVTSSHMRSNGGGTFALLIRSHDNRGCPEDIIIRNNDFAGVHADDGKWRADNGGKLISCENVNPGDLSQYRAGTEPPRWRVPDDIFQTTDPRYFSGRMK